MAVTVTPQKPAGGSLKKLESTVHGRQLWTVTEMRKNLLSIFPVR